MRVTLSSIVALAGLFAGAVQAQMVIGFHTGTAGLGGDISFAGGTAPLVGTNIPLGYLSLTNTPVNQGTYPMTGPAAGSGGTYAALNFTTGNFVSYSNGVYTFDAGGSLTITGGVAAIPLPATTVLATGTAVSAIYDSSLGVLSLVLATGSDTKDPALITFAGLPANTTFHFVAGVHNFMSAGGNGGAFEAIATGSTDIDNRLLPLTLTCPASTGQFNVPYNSALVASGGLGPYTYAITAGSLPGGLTLNPATGAITGTPTGFGTFTFTAKVTDSEAGTASTTTSSCSIVIGPPQPIALTCAGNTGQVGVPYNSSLNATGGVPPYNFSIISGGLPDGLMLNPATGAITGTPTTAGPFLFTAQVADSTGSLSGTTTTNCSITVAPPNMTALCAAVTTGKVGVPYSSSITVSGGTAPYTFSLNSGSLPAGLSLDPSSGVISGTPTAVGPSSFTVKVTDSTFGVHAIAVTSNCGITIASPDMTAQCATAITGKVGVPYSSSITVTGGTAPYTFAINSGALPAGLTLNPASGAITGTPTTAGPFSFTVKVTDSTGGVQAVAITGNCGITIAPPDMTAACASDNSGKVGVPFSASITVTGGTAPYTFAINSGALPAGLTLNPASGAITGTPTTAGPFSFTVKVTDSTGGVQAVAITGNCGITIAPPDMTAACASDNSGKVGAPFSTSITVTGGTAPYTFAINSGALPAGLTLNPASGAITGTPTTAGPFSFTVKVTDSTGGVQAVAITGNCGITIAPPDMTAACASDNSGKVGVPFNASITVTGGTAPYTFAINSGALPAGLTLNPASGAITGTPTAAGPFSFTVKVTDSTGGVHAVAITGNCGITIAPPDMTALCAAVTTGTVGSPYSSLITVTGGTAPFTFAVTSGALPAGLTLNPATGAITGTPTTAGPFSFQVTVTDSTPGVHATATTGNCSITIAPPAMTALCAAVTTGTVGSPYSSMITVTGGTAPFTFTVTAGALPAGLTLNPTTGAITGTPTTAGPFSFQVTVTDSTPGVHATATTSNCSITIAPPALNAYCAPGTTGQVGVPFSSQVQASGGTAPYTFTLNSGALPAGLTLSASGLISGTPTTAGAFSFTVKVTDSTGGTKLVAITSGCSITIAPTPLNAYCAPGTTGQVGVPFSSQVQASGGTAPYTFTLNSGALPAGLTLSASGLISGTPTTAGTFSFTVKVTDSTGGTKLIAITSGCTITIAPPPTATCIVISAVQGVAITPVTMTATGGAGAPYTFSATGLPAGVTMSTTGTISGTPTVSGTFSYTVTIKDKNNNIGTVNCSVTVNPPVVCAPASFNLTGNSASTGTPGNIRTFTSGSMQVKASAFAKNKSTGAWSTAYLGSYPLGLGVTDGSESGADPTHRVDNIGNYNNYVMFEFSSPVIVDRAFLDAVGADSDISVWVGTKTDPFNNHQTLSDAFLTGMQFEENLASAAGARWADINNTNLSGNVVVIAALVSDTSPEDEFKITTLETKCPTTACTGTIGDFVWSDTNKNGLQDTGEPGISAVTVQLKSGTTILATRTTSTTGYYQFGGLCAGTYTVVVPTTPAGYSPTTSLVGTNRATDSNGSPATVTLPANNSSDQTIDFGYTPVTSVCAVTTFDLTGNTASTGTAGNVRTFTSGNLKVKASGFARNKSNGAWSTAYLGSYSPGLGVTDNTEDGTNPSHKVDNVGSNVNYVLFEFSAPVIVNRAFLDAIGADSDLTVWVGTRNDPFNNHTNLSDAVLGGLALMEENLTTSTATSRWADINNGSVIGNVLVIAALASDTTAEDEFKISKLETSCPGSIATGAYATYTQGGWGAPPNGSNVAMLLKNNFASVYPGGSVSIGGTYKSKFTSATAIQAFLPVGGTPGVLNSNTTNPTTSTAGVFAGQVLALQLNVDFSNKGLIKPGLANLHVAAGTLEGLTVSQMLALANYALGGGALPSGLTLSDLSSAVDAINNNFDNGTVNKGYLY